MHLINDTRIHSLNNIPSEEGSVMYWMSRDMRHRDNYALLHAQNLSIQYNSDLIVFYNLVPNYLGGSYRQWAFMLDCFFYNFSHFL